MAAELAPDRIRVNAISPAIGHTPMAEGMFDGDQEALQGMVQTIPLGRLCAPEDIASAATYMASDEAAFVTGIVPPVDGGRIVG